MDHQQLRRTLRFNGHASVRAPIDAPRSGLWPERGRVTVNCLVDKATSDR